MSMDVKINISSAKPIGSVGFGVPLILEEGATKAIAYTKVSSLDALTKAGYTIDSDVYKVAQLMFMQEHAPETIAVCSATETATVWLAEEANVSKDWRQLVVIGETAVADIMSVIEAQTKYPKMFYANLPFDDETTLTVTGVERTVLCYYTPTAEIPVPVAAIVGEIAGLQVGSYTLNNLTVKGIAGLELSNDEVNAITAKGGITFVISAGDVVVSEGITAGGLWVDDVDNDDYIKMQLEYRTQKVFNNNLKVPYTNVGIAMLENAAYGVMKDAQNKSICDSFTVAYALREDTTEEDRSNRKYFGGNISYVRAGAIHYIEINAEATF